MAENNPTTRSTGQFAARKAARDMAILWRQRRVVLVITLAFTAVSAGLAFLLPPQYMATVKIMTPLQSPSSASALTNQMAMTGTSALASIGGGSAFGLKNPNELYIGILQARSIADAIIAHFKLGAVYHASDATSARQALEKNTSIYSEKSGLISISVKAHDRQLAADIANDYPVQLRELTKNIAITEAARRRLFYESQVRDAKEAIVTAAAKLLEIQRQKKLVQLDVQVKSAVESLVGINARISAKQAELQAIRSYSTEHNANVQLLEKELESLRNQASSLENSRSGQSSGQMGLQDMASAGTDLLRAERELQYRQTLYDLLMKQYDVARMDEAKEALVIQVVEPAVAPERRYFPRRTPFILIGFLLGLAAACLWALTLEKIRTSSQLQEIFSELKADLCR